MEFTVNRKDFVHELTLAKECVEQKTTIPILSHVLIETGEGCVNITTTDLELGMRCSCPATVIKSGSAAIPAKRLLDYVRLLPDADVAVQVKTSDNNWATLTCERSKARIAGLGREAFPELPKATPTTAEIPVWVLASAISKVIFAVSKEESRFTLKGALLNWTYQGFSLVATDGHRMALTTAGVPAGLPTKVIIPLKAMGKILNLAKDDPEAPLYYSEDENHLFFGVGSRQLLSRKMTGNFPDYERVLPKDQPIVAVVGPEQFKGCVERVAQFSDERSHSIRVTLANSEITCKSAVTDTGDSEESVAAQYEGDAVEIGFNATYLLDFLKVCGATQVELRLKDANTAGELRPVGSDDYRYILMPMRI